MNFNYVEPLPPDTYEVGVAKVTQSRGMWAPAETIVIFRVLPQPEKHMHHHLGGRLVGAWFAPDDPNPVTAEQERNRLLALATACGLDDADDPAALEGRRLRVRVSRVVTRRDPSEYKAEAVEFLSEFEP